MKVGILGAGGTGSLIGYFLYKAGVDVWLVDINKAHVDAINKDGLYVKVMNAGLNKYIEETINIKASSSAKEVGPCDLVIILTKEPATKAAIEGSKELFDDDSFVLILQNGIGNEDTVLMYFPDERVGRGVATVSGTLYEPGKINCHYGLDPLALRFGSIKGGNPWQLVELEEKMNQTDAKAKLCNNIMKIVWDKALLNLPTSFVTGIVGVPEPIINATESGRALNRAILSEAIDVAVASGIEYNKEEEIDRFINESASILVKFSSAARDMFCQRITEVEAINGAVGRIGRRLGIKTPVNDTIANLVRTIQQTYEEQNKVNRFE